MLKVMEKIMDPTRFQNLKKNKYFEGWYFKIVSQDMESVLAIIPGVSKGDSENCCFIQIFNPCENKNYYLKYKIEDLSYEDGEFNIKIKNSFFSSHMIDLDIDEKDIKLKGKLCFKEVRKYPKTLTKPNIMGPYSFVPFMECSHAVLSINNYIEGSLELNGKEVNFNGGKGYIEKDWGTSFPSEWIWIQSNHFNRKDTSFMVSIAKIPWLKGEFVGLIGFLSIDKSNLLFSTYNKNFIRNLDYCNNTLSFEIVDKEYIIQIEAKNKSGVLLKAPGEGEMNRTIKESLDSEIKIKVIGKDQGVIYEDRGVCSGLEVSENFQALGTVDWT